ncbi:MAG: maleylpyruvate isomerase family mycothiol-dependent enzyme [Acidimicrobiia bacterium]
MAVPVADIELVRHASRRLLRTADELTDDEVGEPCLLPGWSRAELLTHLARNADGTRGMVEAAARNEVAPMYPGGPDRRAADIAAGRGERAQVVVADLRHSIDALMETWQSLPPDAWDSVGRTLTADRTMRVMAWVRLREVEIHHADLDVDYAAADWPVAFVTRALAEAVRELPARAVANRPAVDARYRLEASDHGRAWTIELAGNRVVVHEDDNGAADATVAGWGCDLLAWLYGRTATGESVTVGGADTRALRLPTWFPYS